MSARLEIARLGAQGDGVADTERGPVYVPFALPGEVVTAAIGRDSRADLIAVLEPSPERVTPPCRHFGECGGCALQHLEHAAYLDWKRDRLVSALARAGLDAPVEPTVPCPPASRRRVVLAARPTEHGVVLGYHRALSHTVIDIVECPIAEPAIVEALATLRRLAELIGAAARQAFALAVTRTASGLDVAATGSGPLSAAARRAAADFAISAGLARLAVDGEVVIEPRKPQILFGRVPVSPPPGGFVQAVAVAEDAMAALVCGHLAKARRVADLFAGAGAFALRLAATAEVHAVEADAAALAALDQGYRRASGLRRVAVERRDLFRRPLTAKELAAFDGLVFDPPRAGAEEQSRQIARSDVPLVAAVSCNPVTLARDLALLTAGGYRLTRVVPVDQFLWSAHVEAVALLEKKPLRRASRR